MTSSHLNFTRRHFIGTAAGISINSLLPGCHPLTQNQTNITINRPGVDLGHMMRDYSQWPAPVSQRSCPLIIIGSGSAALTAAWKLVKEGYRDFIMLEGPEPNGNNAGISGTEVKCPTGAHYLALPSAESFHVRELLADLNILIGNPAAKQPVYDEMVLVHAPEERLLVNGQWHDSFLPKQDADSIRFFKFIQSILHAKGQDGRKLFAIPVIHSSQDTEWSKLDRMTFTQWLTQQNYHSPSLRWYLNYCCRDDYGQGINQVSAWAGLHYFAARAGEAKNTENGSVLTWPNGLAGLSELIRSRINFHSTSLNPPEQDSKREYPQTISASVLRLTEQKHYVDLLIGQLKSGKMQTVRIKADHVICCMPLYIASRVIPQLNEFGYDANIHTPAYASWLVSNFTFDRFPHEQPGASLSWDNVVYNGKGLGYVVATHQLIRLARPPRTTFTAYYAMDEELPQITRTKLTTASAKALLQIATTDLEEAYGRNLWPYMTQAAITIRGHGMASPHPGYRHNHGLTALQEKHGRLLFAHSDLSGYSVFEEAAWWGYQAALKCINSFS